MAGIDIKNTPTTYTSDAIILPTEILLLIRSFLRDQPVPRSRCRLVCHLWFHFFRVENMTRIASTEDMNVMARIMTSQENRRFGRFVSSMTVRDNPAKPFAHGLPLRLQGYHFTRLRRMELVDINWTATRPHPLFFHRVSYFSTVEELCLIRCHLHRADDLWNILSAIPSLLKVQIDSVTVQLDLFNRHTKPALEHLPKLCSLDLRSRAMFFYSDHVQCTQYTPLVLPRIVIDVLSLLSMLTELHLDLDRFSTFYDLEHLICAFPALDIATIRGDPSWQFPTSSASPFSPTTDTQIAKMSWGTIHLYAMPYNTALGFCTSFQSRGLRRLAIDICGAPSPSNSLAGSLLKHAGATLTSFQWTYKNPEPPDVSFKDPECALWAGVPLFNFVHNIVIERIDVTIPLPSTLLGLYQTLLALLSSIMSPHLYRLHILFDGLANNWEEVGDFGLSEDAVDTFHACLSRDAFVGLGRDGVYIKLGLPSDAAGPWLVRLFGPWLTRGVLGIKLPGHMLESTEELPEPCL